ncbi:BamA/TamA family outer membrane protein [bacterium]|nr:BamA/TamA family outer membrane protein [bacterium]
MKKILCLVFLCFWNFSQAKEIQKIQVFGNNFFSQNSILKKLELKIPFTLDLLQLENKLRQLLKNYETEGFYFAEIDSVTFPNETLQIFVSEGNPLKLRSLVFEGNKFLEKDKIQNEIFLKNGRTFLLENLLNDVDGILKLYSENGFPFAQIEILNLKIDFYSETDSIDLALKITEESYTKIDEIRVSGNQATDKNFILQESRLKIGSEFQENKLEKAKTRLVKTGLFDSVKEPQLFITPNKNNGILLEIIEGKNNRIDGIIGYVPQTIRNSGYFTGFLDLSFRNLLGKGKQLEAKISKKDQETQEFEISYFEPWFFGEPFGIGGNLKQLVQDSIYTEFDYSLNFKFPVNENFLVGTKIGKNEVTPAFTGIQSPFWIPKSNAWTFEGNLRFDKIDNFYNPRKGFVYETIFKLFLRQNRVLLADTAGNEPPEIKEKVSVKKTSISFSVFVPTLRKQTLALKLVGESVSSNDVEIGTSDLFHFGGTKTIRGYLENQFLANNVVWTNLEYRFLQGKKSRVFFFSDNGFYTKNKSDKNFDFVYSYGLGLKLETKAGIISIDYAIGGEDKFTNGKIHVGIVNEF